MVATGANSGANGMILIIIIWGILGLLIYFIPTFIARKKNHLQKTAITLVNIFLGWTFVGWVVALVWAVMKQPESAGQKLEVSVGKTETSVQE